jgi:hypothetical protein
MNLEPFESDRSRDSSDKFDVNYSVTRLEKISSQLRFIGNIILLLTLFNMFSTIAAFYFSQVWNVIIAKNALKDPFGYSTYNYSTYTVEQSFYIAASLSFIFLIICIFLLITFDKQKRQGNVLFEEISDELQWWMLSKNSSDTNKENNILVEKERPILRIRIALREFAHTTDLPLMRSSYGSIMYFLLNIISTALTAFALFLTAGNL